MTQPSEMPLRRWNASIAFRCRWRNQAIDGKTVNLSYGGACLQHPVVAPPPGEQVLLTLLSSGCQVDLEARVVHRRIESDSPNRPTIFGVQFQGSAYEISDKLASVLATLAV